jgi:hypothetical protein
MVKAALELAGLLPNRIVRAPQLAATPGQVAELRRDLISAELLEDNTV